MRKQERYKYVLDYLAGTWNETETELNYSNNFELLVAVVLSAQCTDKRINQITPRLFADYPTPEAMSLATPEVLYDYIKTVSYPNNKAKHLVGLSQGLVERFGGEVPSTLEELTSLPGVGRKSANLIMGDIFGEPAIVTDTHCIRLVNRIGLVDQVKEPAKVEKLLWDLVPPEESNQFCHRLVDHGRAVCTARKPDCGHCVLNDLCRYAKEEQPFGLGEL